jgi:hypothetical protein
MKSILSGVLARFINTDQARIYDAAIAAVKEEGTLC